MTRTAGIALALAVAGTAALVPATAAAAHTPTRGACAPARPGPGFYAAGRIASEPVTVPASPCTTIAVSHIRDAGDPTDRCQTFLLAFLDPSGGDPTYSEPVRACSPTPRHRTVLATDVPDGTVFRVLYEIDYLEPEPQTVRYTVWR